MSQDSAISSVLVAGPMPGFKGKAKQESLSPSKQFASLPGSESGAASKTGESSSWTSFQDWAEDPALWGKSDGSTSSLTEPVKTIEVRRASQPA